MARRFRKEFVKLFIKTHISNAELRVEKVSDRKKKLNTSILFFRPTETLALYYEVI